jgi:hypothetical protein
MPLVIIRFRIEAAWQRNDHWSIARCDARPSRFSPHVQRADSGDQLSVIQPCRCYTCCLDASPAHSGCH